jgi:deoxyhypusine synthase
MVEYVEDLKWEKNMKVKDLVKSYRNIGYQSIELHKAKDLLVKMKKNSAKTFLTFTSNMVTSGLRGFFAQLIKLKMAHIIVTTVGAVEEDIMRALGEKFPIGNFNADDVELHEQGINRVGNLLINNESYMKLEDSLLPIFDK